MTDKELVDAHWKYVEDLLEVHFPSTCEQVKSDEIEIIGFHYRTAMLHGIKHGRALERQLIEKGTE